MTDVTQSNGFDDLLDFSVESTPIGNDFEDLFLGVEESPVLSTDELLLSYFPQDYLRNSTEGLVVVGDLPTLGISQPWPINRPFTQPGEEICYNPRSERWAIGGVTRVILTVTEGCLEVYAAPGSSSYATASSLEEHLERVGRNAAMRMEAAMAAMMESGDSDGDYGGSYDGDYGGCVYPYNTDVPQLLGVSIPRELCLGMEAEFLSTNEDNLLLTLSNLHNKAIFKFDSSCGVELVSVPLLPLEMLEFINGLDVAHLEVDRSCGVHIHLSRRYLTQSQLGGLVVFMNHPHNLPYIEQVAGRSCNNYCKQVPGKQTTVSNDRYEMVNLTNANTVEIRIFAGTNSTDTLRGYVEWLLDLLKWLGTNPSSYLATEFIAFNK